MHSSAVIFLLLAAPHLVVAAQRGAILHEGTQHLAIDGGWHLADPSFSLGRCSLCLGTALEGCCQLKARLQLMFGCRCSPNDLALLLENPINFGLGVLQGLSEHVLWHSLPGFKLHDPLHRQT